MSQTYDGYKVHDKKVCTPPCPFHAPSDHPLKDAPIHIRADKGMLVERICQHGVGHDDPDSVAYLFAHGVDAGVHGCDGCCSEKVTKTPNSVDELEQILRSHTSSILWADAMDMLKADPEFLKRIDKVVASTAETILALIEAEKVKARLDEINNFADFIEEVLSDNEVKRLIIRDLTLRIRQLKKTDGNHDLQQRD